MKTIEEYTWEAQELREYGRTLFNLNHHSLALNKIASATRIETYMQVLKGANDIMKDCIESWPSSEFIPKPGPPQKSKRRYQLIDTQSSNRRSIDIQARQAMKQIAYRQRKAK